MVVGRVRVRDEQRRPPDRRDLGDGPRPGPGDDEVGPPEVVRELRRERDDARACDPCPGIRLPHGRVLPLARLVHDEQPAAQARDATERLREPLVERLGPLAAAEHEHPRQGGRGGPARAEPGAERDPRKAHARAGEERARAVEGEVDAPRQRGEDAVREPHHAVGLHDRDGDPQPRGRERDGPCRVPSDADDRRGGPQAQEVDGASERATGAEPPLRDLQRPASVDRRDVEQLDLVARCRHELPLEPARRADEDRADPRLRDERVGEREPGEHVAAGPPRGDDDAGAFAHDMASSGSPSSANGSASAGSSGAQQEPVGRQVLAARC